MRARGFQGLLGVFEAFVAWAVSAFFHGIKHGINNARHSAAVLLSICFVLTLGQISQAQDSSDVTVVLPESETVNEIGIGEADAGVPAPSGGDIEGTYQTAGLSALD